MGDQSSKGCGGVINNRRGVAWVINDQGCACVAWVINDQGCVARVINDQGCGMGDQ